MNNCYLEVKKMVHIYFETEILGHSYLGQEISETQLFRH